MNKEENIKKTIEENTGESIEDMGLEDEVEEVVEKNPIKPIKNNEQNI